MTRWPRQAALKQNNMHPFHQHGINNQLRRQQESEAVDVDHVIHGSWRHEYENKPMNNRIAFTALLAYDINCREKYDRPGRPSLPPKKGDTMQDFAYEYGTTVEKMKQEWPALERYNSHCHE